MTEEFGAGVFGCLAAGTGTGTGFGTSTVYGYPGAIQSDLGAEYGCATGPKAPLYVGP